ncbi:Amino Acid-Polyamine-Organocation (APC) Family [Achlya hypogyna]|uniref:Amino Acid-Polyamine-Organocation (APC) Family n=1 Tax=Achlya hypogyna TaxID=1202772 RepID=A0A1V9YC57_ACHHY|nr:Amino Acid-Polyamine-Organocation (APC) Family [Achlya hypogyna]
MQRPPPATPSFDSFYEALVQSRPSRAALALGKLSIGNKKFALERIYAKPATPPPRRAPPADTLDVLLALQQSDGRWKLNEDLQTCLYGVVPPAPEGVTEGMWATGCALAVLRRHPEHYDRLEKACAVALAHVDSHAFETAKLLMPPVPLAIAPEVYIRGNTPAPVPPIVYDADVLSRSILREMPVAARVLLRRGCRRELDYRVVNQRARAPFTAGEAVEACWRKTSKSVLAVPEVQSVWAPAQVLYVHAAMSLYDIQYEHGAREKVVRVPGKYLRRPGITHLETAKSMVDHVQERWLTPVPIHEEIERCTAALSVQAQRPEWCSDPVYQRRSGTPPKLRPIRRKTKATRDDAGSEGLLGEPSTTLTPLETDVIAAILRHENALKSLHEEVDSCSRLYTKARVFAEKIHAFDAFTTLAPSVVQSTLECIELVATLQATLESPGGPYVPFLWHGRPFLSTVLHQFDALQTYPHLVDWYGVDFYFECNPFLMTTTVGCRKRAWSRYDVVQNTWWPEAGYAPSLLRAVTAGEERLLEHWHRSELCHSWV